MIFFTHNNYLQGSTHHADSKKDYDSHARDPDAYRKVIVGQEQCFEREVSTTFALYLKNSEYQ